MTVDQLRRPTTTRPTLTGTVNDPIPSSGVSGNVTVVVGTQTLTATVSGTYLGLDMSRAAQRHYPQPLGDGSYDVTVTATDNALNIGSSPTTAALIVDTSKPIGDRDKQADDQQPHADLDRDGE